MLISYFTFLVSSLHFRDRGLDPFIFLRTIKKLLIYELYIKGNIFVDLLYFSKEKKHKHMMKFNDQVFSKVVDLNIIHNALMICVLYYYCINLTIKLLYFMTYGILNKMFCHYKSIPNRHRIYEMEISYFSILFH